MILLDTDIMVDIQRGYLPAVHWLSGLTDTVGIPGLVMLELLQGARNKNEANRLLKTARSFRIYWPSSSDCDRALSTFAHIKLSHGVGAFDALIGECAVGLDATLCTFNTKHYRHIAGLRTHQPYARWRS